MCTAGSEADGMAQQAYMTETADGGSGPERPGSRLRRLLHRMLAPWRNDSGIWRRGAVLTALALLLALVMLLHAHVPNTVGNLGSLTETFLPWLGVFVPVLLLLGLWRKSAITLIAVLLPAIVWLNLFGGLLTDKSSGGGELMVATHNVNADNPDPVGTARAVAAPAPTSSHWRRSPRPRCRCTSRRSRRRTSTTRSRARSGCGASTR